MTIAAAAVLTDDEPGGDVPLYGAEDLSAEARGGSRGVQGTLDRDVRLGAAGGLGKKERKRQWNKSD